MKDYIYMILCVSLICGTFKLLFSSSKMSTFVTFALKIIILCVILTPLFKFANVEVNDMNFFVINGKSAHSIVSEEQDSVWKFWMAKTSSEKLSEEIEKNIFNSFGVKTLVEVPFGEKDGQIVFENIKITADCNERTCAKIEDFISLRYSLKSVCKTGEVND